MLAILFFYRVTFLLILCKYDLLTITTASVYLSTIKQSVSTFSVISFNQTCYLFKDNYHLVIANWYSLNNLWDINIYRII